MDRLRLVALVGLALTLGGCTAVESDLSTATLPPTVTADPVAEIVHPTPDAEFSSIVAYLDSQRGPQSVGTFERESDVLFVDLTCAGDGGVDLVIDGVGEFALPCTPDGSQQTHSEFEVGFVDVYSVSVRADLEQLWAITVSLPST